MADLFDSPPIGVIDSGVGGLSILREMRAQLPDEHLLFVGDQGHVPYGPRSIEQVRAFLQGIARFLIGEGVKMIVVACNTASAAALYSLRASFPDMPFVGMEPAVKPAAGQTRSGVIGVIATEATFQTELYASVVGRFAQGVDVRTRACPEFVLLVEAGDQHSERARAAVERCLRPLLEAGIDQLVLGCTHFPFLAETMRAVIGPGVTLVDPSAAVARQAGRVLAQIGPRLDDTPGRVVYTTTGDPVAFRRVMGALLGDAVAESADVRGLRWLGDEVMWIESEKKREP